MAVKKEHPLKGRYFHTFAENTQVQYQGQIMEVADGHVLVLLFDWIHGGESVLKWFSFSAVETWNLYESQEHMRDEYQHLKLREPK